MIDFLRKQLLEKTVKDNPDVFRGIVGTKIVAVDILNVGTGQTEHLGMTFLSPDGTTQRHSFCMSVPYGIEVG